MTLLLKALRKTGYFFQIGLFDKLVLLDLDLALVKKINISNSFASERTSWERHCVCLSLKWPIEPLVGSHIKLENWEEGFKRRVDKLDFKVLLMP